MGDMRVLPVIEWVGVAVAAVVVVSVLGFLVAWHLRWNAMQRFIAGIPEDARVTVPAPAVAAGAGDYLAWSARMDQFAFCQQISAVDVHDADGRRTVTGLLDGLHAVLARGWHYDGPAQGGSAVIDASALVEAAELWSGRAERNGEVDAALAADAEIVAALVPCVDVEGLRKCTAICAERDQMCLRLAVAGRLPPAAWRRWRDDAGMDPGQLLSTLDGERRRWIPRAAAADFALDPFAFWHRRRQDAGWMDGGRVLAQWWGGPDQLVENLKQVATAEDAVARRDPQVQWDGELWALHDADRDMKETMLLHRMAVVAAAVIGRRGGDAAYPATLPAEIDASAGPDRLAVVYARSADGFRIDADGGSGWMARPTGPRIAGGMGNYDVEEGQVRLVVTPWTAIASGR